MEDHFQNELNKINRFMAVVYLWFIVSIIAFVFLLMGGGQKDWNSVENQDAPNDEKIVLNMDMDSTVVNDIHVATGMIYDSGFEEVYQSCTGCHSSKLITQNRANRSGWKNLITWMQETQGLWDLGDKEPVILDYLSKNYAPQEVGRRAVLNVEEIEWYKLEK